MEILHEFESTHKGGFNYYCKSRFHVFTLLYHIFFLYIDVLISWEIIGRKQVIKINVTMLFLFFIKSKCKFLVEEIKDTIRIVIVCNYKLFILLHLKLDSRS